MQQLLVFIKKEFKHVFRDQKTLLLLFGLPIAQIVLFGFALTNEIKDASILIVDHSKDPTTQKITEKFRNSNSFLLEEAALSPEAIEEAFLSGRVKLAIIFDHDFESTLLQEGKAAVQIIADATDPNTATTLATYASSILQEFLLSQGQAPPPPTIHLEQRNIYNPELKGTTNFVPGVMALVLLLICVLMTSVSIVKEKELGTMEILLVSPFNPFLVIVAKAIPYLLLSIVNLTVILLLSVFLLDTPINGSVPLLFGVSIVLIMAALALGLLISNVTASQQMAMFISLLGMLLPTMLFTGFLFPLENMPWPLQVIANIVPSKWYYIIVKDVMIKGLGFGAIWKETLILLGMTVFLLTLSIRKFKTRLA